MYALVSEKQDNEDLCLGVKNFIGLEADKSMNDLKFKFWTD